MLDLRFLARRKALASIAVLTMALAIGVTTATLAVLGAFLRSGLAVPEPERVVVVSPRRELPGRGAVQFSDAWPNYMLLRQVQRSFSSVAAVVQSSASWNDHGEARQLAATRATASFFATMGVQPTLGRAFRQDEEGPSPAPVVVISHALWSSTFGADPRAVGTAMSINGAPHTVVGVMPPGFAQPLPADIWLPFDIPAIQRTMISGGRQLTLFARLAKGTSFEGAQRDMAAFTARALEASPADNKNYSYTIQTLRDNLLSGADSSAMFVLGGGAGLLLLAILNLASLLVAWGLERRREIAVRVALGASTRRVVRLLLEQSLVIVGAGAVAGIGLAFVALRLLRQVSFGPTIDPFVARATVDLASLSAATAIAVVAALAAGALPALQTRDVELADSLRLASRSATLSRGALAWQKAMVLGQAALSVALLAAAALIGLSYWRLAAVPDGFEDEGRVVARVVLPDATYATHPARAAFGRALDEALAAEREIAAAGFTTTLPVGDGAWGSRFLVELPDGSTVSDPVLFHFRRVSPSYFGAIGIPLLRGRAFTAGDDTASVPVAIVSRALAERLWPRQDPIGRQLVRAGTGGSKNVSLAIVGVAGNTMDGGYGAPAGETVYVPYAQNSVTRLSIVARTRGNPAATVAAIRHALGRADPVVAAGAVASLDGLVVQANALPRLRALVLVLFAGVALGIVSLGSYSVMSQLVSSRERELALRLIFGARRGQLGGAVIGQVARLTLPGIAAGLAGVWTMQKVLAPFLFAVEPASLSVLATAGGALLGLATVAAVPSALRVMRIDVRRGMGG